MNLSLKDILRTSRPLLWLNTAVLWLVGLLVLDLSPTIGDLVMVGYFTLPFNLWLHGINDVHDYAADRLNARKGGDEGALLAEALHVPLLRAVRVWNVPFWLFAVWQGTPLSALLLALFVVLGWAYSAPPVRGKSRPFIDSLINVGYILPYPIALAWHDAPEEAWALSVPAIAAFACWAIASHAFTSIQDIEADRAAGDRSIATALGATNTARFALAGYLVAASIASVYGVVCGLLLLMFALYVLWYLREPSRERANRLYRLFIATNSGIGFLVTVTLSLSHPRLTYWAAAILCALVALVAVALHFTREKANTTT